MSTNNKSESRIPISARRVNSRSNLTSSESSSKLKKSSSLYNTSTPRLKKSASSTSTGLSSARGTRIASPPSARSNAKSRIASPPSARSNAKSRIASPPSDRSNAKSRIASPPSARSNAKSRVVSPPSDRKAAANTSSNSKVTPTKKKPSPGRMKKKRSPNRSSPNDKNNNDSGVDPFAPSEIGRQAPNSVASLLALALDSEDDPGAILNDGSSSDSSILEAVAEANEPGEIATSSKKIKIDKPIKKKVISSNNNSNNNDDKKKVQKSKILTKPLVRNDSLQPGLSSSSNDDKNKKIDLPPSPPPSPPPDEDDELSTNSKASNKSLKFNEVTIDVDSQPKRKPKPAHRRRPSNEFGEKVRDKEKQLRRQSTTNNNKNDSSPTSSSNSNNNNNNNNNTGTSTTIKHSRRPSNEFLVKKDQQLSVMSDKLKTTAEELSNLIVTMPFHMFDHYLRTENIDLNSDDYIIGEKSLKLRPIHVAAYHGKSDICKVLIQHKAKIDTPNVAGQSAIMFAVGGDHLDTVKTLISLKADPNIQDKHGLTCLHSAVQKSSSADMVDYLVRTVKVKLDLFDENGMTAYHHCIEFNNLKAVEIMVQSGMDSNQLSKNGSHPIHAMVQHARLTMLQMLQRYNIVTLPFAGAHGGTPLHIGVIHEQADIIEYLLNNYRKTKKQYAVYVKNWDGYTPLALARARLESRLTDVRKRIVDLLTASTLQGEGDNNNEVSADIISKAEQFQQRLMKNVINLRKNDIDVRTRPEELKTEGNILFKENKKYMAAMQSYSEAIAILETAYGQNPSDFNIQRLLAAVYNNRSVSKLKINDPEGALSDADRSIKLQPKWCKPRLRKAKALIFIKDADAALDEIKHGLKLDPTAKQRQSFYRQRRKAIAINKNDTLGGTSSSSSFSLNFGKFAPGGTTATNKSEQKHHPTLAMTGRPSAKSSFTAVKADSIAMKQMARHCVICGSPNSFACTKCEQVYYCTPAHQSADFPIHNRVCNEYLVAKQCEEVINKALQGVSRNMTNMATSGFAYTAKIIQAGWMPSSQLAVNASFDTWQQWFSERFADGGVGPMKDEQNPSPQHRVVTNFYSWALTLDYALRKIKFKYPPTKDIFRIHLVTESSFAMPVFTFQEATQLLRRKHASFTVIYLPRVSRVKTKAPNMVSQEEANGLKTTIREFRGHYHQLHKKDAKYRPPNVIMFLNCAMYANSAKVKTLDMLQLEDTFKNTTVLLTGYDSNEHRSMEDFMRQDRWTMKCRLSEEKNPFESLRKVPDVTAYNQLQAENSNLIVANRL